MPDASGDELLIRPKVRPASSPSTWLRSPRPWIVAGSTLAGALWLRAIGPLPVLRGSTPLAEAAPFSYMLLAFPVLGFLLADAFELLRTRGLARPTLELTAQIAVLVLLSSARLGLRLPLSGHALLFTYFLARRRLLPLPPTRWATGELALAAAGLLYIAYLKLARWDDPLTLGTGLAGGIFLAIVSWTLVRRR